jgi:hypothetical protein
VSRTASKTRSVASGTRFSFGGLMKGLTGLGWGRSRLTGSGVDSGWGTWDAVGGRFAIARIVRRHGWKDEAAVSMANKAG